jgi:Fuc2NAc and GlcNAc transferase
VLWAWRGVDASMAVALVGAGSLVTLVGFLDDHRPVAARWRLFAHFSAAVWALFWLGGVPPLSFTGGAVELGWAGDALTILALVWMLNLYNFMDGIDGLAGLEGVTVCLGAVLLYALNPISNSAWELPTLLGVATLGFLLWNLPPAKIFMGDAGSGFLGLMLGIFAVHASSLSPDWIWSWVILLGAFIVDATVTLVRRLLRGQSATKAHRSHAYQHAAQHFQSHGTVTLAVAAINVLWLIPLALFVGTGRVNGMVGTVIAYVPLIWLSVRFDAGLTTR